MTQDGRCLILGRSVPVTGRVNITPGETVAVAWTDGQPVVVLMNEGRRAGPPPALGVEVLPLLEELFIATRPADGVRDVFFRSADQCRPLRLERFGLNPAQLNTVGFGPGNDRFFVQTGANVFHVMKFRRERFVPFAAGADASQKVTRERTEDLAANGTVLAVVPGVGSFTPASPSVTRTSVTLDVDGALIGSYVLTLAAVNSAPGSDPLPNFDSSSVSAFTNGTFSGPMAWPIIADLTNGIVLLSGFDTPNVFAPLLPAFDFSTPRITYSKTSITVPQAFVRPVTWVAGNSFTTPIDPPFEGHTEIVATWQFGYSATPSSVRITAEPIVVLGRALPAAQRVRGVVAWSRLEYNIFLGQTFDVANWNTFFLFSGQTGYNPISPTAPFPVTPQTGAAARDPYSPQAMVSLYAVQRPARGLAYAATLNRAIWRAPSSVAFNPANGGLNSGGGDTAGFSTLFRTAATAQIATGLRAQVGQHGVNVVPADFAYQLDNPAVALPSSAKRDYFVKIWRFRGAPTVTNLATYPEDTALAQVKALKDVPAGVVQPTGLGEYALQVINARESLDLLGAFEALPGVSQ